MQPRRDQALPDTLCELTAMVVCLEKLLVMCEKEMDKRTEKIRKIEEKKDEMEREREKRGWEGSSLLVRLRSTWWLATSKSVFWLWPTFLPRLFNDVFSRPVALSPS